MIAVFPVKCREKERERRDSHKALGSHWAGFCAFEVCDPTHTRLPAKVALGTSRLCVQACLQCECSYIQFGSLSPALESGLACASFGPMDCGRADMCGFSALVSRGLCSFSSHPLGSPRPACCEEAWSSLPEQRPRHSAR